MKRGGHISFDDSYYYFARAVNPKICNPKRKSQKLATPAKFRRDQGQMTRLKAYLWHTYKLVRFGTEGASERPASQGAPREPRTYRSPLYAAEQNSQRRETNACKITDEHAPRAVDDWIIQMDDGAVRPETPLPGACTTEEHADVV